MAQSLSKVYVHIIFSTKYRANLIDENIEKGLARYSSLIIMALDTMLMMMPFQGKDF